MDETTKTFEQLVAENAGCFEFAWYGFIRLYEEGEKRCECKDCVAMGKLNNDLDAIYCEFDQISNMSLPERRLI